MSTILIRPQLLRPGLGSAAILLAGLVCIGVLACCGDLIAADVFLLRSGGQVEGDLVNLTESPRRSYIIKTELGEISLPRESVEKHVRRRPAEVELDKLRHQHPDTAEGQYALAEWCQKNNLVDARKQFLQRVIELDTDHVDARRALGYGKFEGKWQTRDEAQQSRGYVKFKGRWMLPQEKDAIERTDSDSVEKKLWHQKVETWRGWYVGSRTAEGKQNLLAIRNPLAIDALANRLKTDTNEAVRIVFVEALANIASDEAFRVLAIRSLEDPSQEVRLTCVDYLAKGARPAVVKLFVDRLHDKDNVTINRAAIGLMYLKDASSVGPLIDSLVTKHKTLLTAGAPAGSTTTSFSPQGGGFAVGGGGPKYIENSLQNQSVLDALIAMTGVNFNFDVASWKQWFAAQRRVPGTF